MSKEKTIANAEKYFRENKLDKALKEYRKLLSEDPHDMRAKLKIGDIYARQRNVPQAIQTYMEVGNAYMQENFHLKAIAVFKNVLKMNPTLIEINEKLGQLYHQVGMDQDATSQFLIVANSYEGKGEMDRAIEVRRKILQVDPLNSTSLIRIAEIYQNQGAQDESLTAYRKAAEALKKKGDRNGLIEVYEKITFYHPENIEMLRDLLEIYFERRDFKRALARIEKAPAEAQDSKDILYMWAETLFEDHQVDKSRQVFRDAYSVAAQAGDAALVTRIYDRIVKEFSDDQEYMNDIEALHRETGIRHEHEAAPQHREDMESTTMVDLNKIDEWMKKK